jgi:hypothetical protein
MRFRPAAAMFAPLAALALSAAAPLALAAPPKFALFDHSVESLVKKDAALDILRTAIPAERMNKVYPALRWGFVSQVEGGLTPTGTCVVTARVMLLPTTIGKNLIFTPKQKTTVFDAVPGATREKCAEVASAKLKEAAEGMVSSLLK